MTTILLFTLFIVWVLVAVGALRIQVDIAKADPSEMPGGGFAANGGSA